MLIDKLKDFTYYKNKLPIYMQNTPGIVDQFYVLFQFLQEHDIAEDMLLKSIDVFNPDYLDYINSLDDSASGNKSDILDKLGELYGVSRSFSAPYTFNDVNYPGNVNLDNQWFLYLIRARIVQTTYDGGSKMAREFYVKNNLPIYIISDNTENASCRVLFNAREIGVAQTDVPENILAMFLNGLLTIKSMGISYKHLVIDSESNSLVFDVSFWSSSNITTNWA